MVLKNGEPENSAGSSGRHTSSSRRRALKIGGGVVAGCAISDGVLGTVVNKTPGFATGNYTPPPLPGYTVQTPEVSKRETAKGLMEFPSIAALINNPVDPVALSVQGILNLANSAEEMDISAKGKIIPYFDYTESAYSAGYKASGEIRAPLYNLRIFDPAKYDEATYEVEKEKPENYLQFQSVASHENPKTGDKAIAMLHPETGTLVISTIGFRNEGLSRPFGIFSSEPSRTVSPEFAEQFLGELSDQIRAGHIPARKVLISSHSIGVASGIVMQAEIRTNPKFQNVFSGVPHMVALEGFGESLAADAVAEHYNIPRKEIGFNISSVRVAEPATDEGHECKQNRVVGKRFAIPNIGETKDPHRTDVIAEWLTTKNSEVMPTRKEFTRPGYDMMRFYKDLGGAIKFVRGGKNGLGTIALASPTEEIRQRVR